MLRLLVSAVRAMLLATLRRLRHGPSAPTWSWSLELLVAGYRDGLRASRHMEPARFRALAFAPPSRIAAVSSEAVELGGVPALRLRPAAGAPARSVLYAHGGGWVVESPQTHLDLTASLCADGEACVWSLDYRLAPEHPFPAAPDDVRTAYRALLDQGVDLSQLVVAGDSAGGTLALGLLVQLRERGCLCRRRRS